MNCLKSNVPQNGYAGFGVIKIGLDYKHAVFIDVFARPAPTGARARPE